MRSSCSVGITLQCRHYRNLQVTGYIQRRRFNLAFFTGLNFQSLMMITSLTTLSLFDASYAKPHNFFFCHDFKATKIATNMGPTQMLTLTQSI